MIKSIGYAAKRIRKTLEPCQFTRQEAGEKDLELELLYCGVCHSDVHQVNNDWKNTVWPCVPGHEVVGRVKNIGSGVTTFKVGDLAAVGCMVDSCGTCASCKGGEEQYCESESGWLGTYNGTMEPTGQNSYGGYSDHLVVRESFALHVPSKLDVKAVGPILCAGVTTYSPLKHFGVKAGQKVGIIGFGGLGHMASQIAHAMGAEVTVFTTTPEKTQDALRLGASHVVVSTDKKAMKAVATQFDFLLDTIPERHEIDPYLEVLKRDGKIVLVGVLVPEPGWNNQQVIMKRRTIGGSLIGGIRETQEVLEFCAQHGIAPQVQVITIDEINDVYKKIENKEARYRYVIDLASLESVKDEDAPEIEGVTHRLEAAKSKSAEKAA